MRSRSLLCCLALLTPLAGGGCQREQPYGLVEGVVTLDGKPLTDAEVVFMPDPEKGNTGRRSVALTDKDGRYRIASDGGKGGAPVGMHRVCINDLLYALPGVAPVTPEDNPTGGPVGTKENPATSQKKKMRFPVEYTDIVQTPFRDTEVKDGAQVIDLPLKSVLPK